MPSAPPDVALLTASLNALDTYFFYATIAHTYAAEVNRFIDSSLPGHQRMNDAMIGDTASDNHEMFLILKGKWRFYWGNGPDRYPITHNQ